MQAKSQIAENLYEVDMEKDFDFGIIGSGPAGYTAALSAASSGKKVVLFEKDLIGGVCLNRGCIPTKTMLHSAEIYEYINNSLDLGICVDNCKVDFAKIAERKRAVVEKLRNGLERSFKNAGITIISAKAKILDKNTIEADGKTYSCEQIIAAVGSSPRIIEGMEYDHKLILSSDDVLDFENLPESIVIIGSGAIGIEFSRILSAFNVDVTVVEIAPNLLPLADIEVSKRVERIFKSKGIKFYTNTSVEKIEKSDNRVHIKLSNGEKLEADCTLLAVGRIPNEVEKVDGVTYIGDAAGSIQLAHFASKQALEKVIQIPFDKTLVPSVVYGNPEIAWIGKREQDLESGTYQKAMIPISALAKSQCDGALDGMMKILVRDNKIIGAHIVSKEASSLIQQLVIAMQTNTTVEELKAVCFAHPTYSEGIFECLMRLQ